MSSYGCQQILISPDANLKAILEFACQESNKLANCAIYYCRQLYFKTGGIAHRYDLNKLLKTNPHFKALYSHVGQATLTSVAESFQSFKALRKLSLAGKLNQTPRLPNYRTKDGLNLISFPSADVKLRSESLRFPLGSKVKAWFKLDAFYLPMPSNINYKSIREYRILPRNGCFYLELVYKVEPIQSDVDSSRALGIDHGINNWLTCLSNVGTSFIVDGLHLKSLNQFYNKQVANIKANKPQAFWSKELATITEKRNRQVRDGVNKAARLVINHCIENRIGTVVFGWNVGQKDSANMGKKTNQKFVQIPTGRLKDRIAQLCGQYGIQFIETEESYTSKASFVDRDLLPKIGEKPVRVASRRDGWQQSGKRVKRGLYRTANNQYINADCNGSGNILRKVAATLGLCLEGVSSGALMTPLRFRLWKVQESPAESQINPLADWRRRYGVPSRNKSVSDVLKLCWVAVFCWLAMVAPARADFCQVVDGHRICILSIKRSAKNYWQYQAVVSTDGVSLPSASYDCRERWIVDRDGKVTLFRSRIEGAIVCRLYRR